jgi:hypothetical protein
MFAALSIGRNSFGIRAATGESTRPVKTELPGELTLETINSFNNWPICDRESEASPCLI